MTLSESTGHAPAVVSAVPALGRLMRPCWRGPGRRKSPGADAAEDMGGETVSARAPGDGMTVLMAAASAVAPGTAGTSPGGK